MLVPGSKMSTNPLVVIDMLYHAKTFPPGQLYRLRSHFPQSCFDHMPIASAQVVVYNSLLLTAVNMAGKPIDGGDDVLVGVSIHFIAVRNAS
mmetsp:Transcript_16703/g.31644  ORF Transcript_16703/g.31644 Transcript_16703/m.31644 type:complete len:92 (+) Transcript_16703:1387-1662(+)